MGVEKAPSRIPLAVGLVLIACGWAAIYLAWNQAGEQRIEVGQLPYLISGGFGGLGLLLLGGLGIVVDQVQQSSWRARRALAEVKEALAELGEGLERSLDRLSEHRERDRHEPEEEEERPRPVRRRRRTSSA